MLRVRVKPGFEDEFLRRYDALQRRIAQGIDGHIVHDLCQSADDADRWLIASFWESLEASDAWHESDEHRELTMPLRECWDEVERVRYDVRVATLHPQGRGR